MVDEMFLRTHHGFGTPVVMQGLWRTTERVEAATLAQVHRLLAAGPLGRTVIRPRLPGARPRWQSGATPWPLDYPADAVAADAVVAWADRVARDPVDPEAGAGWRLAAARIDGGGTVVSLVCSHVLADARGLARVLADAMSGSATPPPPPPAHPLRADLADAVRMYGSVGARTLRAVAGLVLHPARIATLSPVRVEHPSRSTDRAQSPEAIVIEVDAARWDAAATRDGGTPNSLLVALAVEVAQPHSPVQVSVPVDRRADPDSPANAVDMVAVTIGPGDSPAAVRTALRAAYAQPPMSSPAGFPPELLQLVSDATAHRLAPNPGERDVLCSNIGTIPDALSSLGGHRASGIATRAVHPGVTPAQAAGARNRLSAYMCRVQGRYTLALVSMDGGLRARTEEALGAHGLSARYW
ncbi:hypothetical protein [Rhodococcus sp. NPDC127528]|uniref:hypothetical protein n=1 Tax=unclassified Rhodococcus (in: high G+C Gram-positive bacteria) TaxID=192944 RepID=UPI00363FCFA1